SLHDALPICRPVILAFYPVDWSPVCGDQVVLYNELLPEFQRFNAAMLGISVDGFWRYLAFAKDRKLRFPLLSDFEPRGAVARSYGAYRQQDGTPTFFINGGRHDGPWGLLSFIARTEHAARGRRAVKWRKWAPSRENRFASSFRSAERTAMRARFTLRRKWRRATPRFSSCTRVRGRMKSGTRISRGRAKRRDMNAASRVSAYLRGR